MSGFTKLYRSIVTSSIWVADDITLRVWVAFLATTDPTGFVEGSIPGLANLCGKTVPELEAALAILAGPDQYSRTPDNEGRRIEAVDGGWQIINFGKFRAGRDDEERRRQVREAVARHRAKKRALPENQDVSRGKPRKAQFDPLDVAVPFELASVAFDAGWRDFVVYRQRLGKPFKTEDGPRAAFRHLIPLGQERAVLALQITREKEWQGVEYGIAELQKREAEARPAGSAPPSPVEVRRRGAHKLALARRALIQRAFGDATLTREQRDSIIEAAERSTGVEDLERILWPS